MDERFRTPVLRVDIMTYSVDPFGAEQMLDRQTVFPDDAVGDSPPSLPLSLPHVVDSVQFGGHIFGTPGTTKVEAQHDEHGRVVGLVCLDSAGRRTAEIAADYDVEGRLIRVLQDSGAAEVLTRYGDTAIETVTRLHGIDVSRKRVVVDSRGFVIAEEQTSLGAPPRRTAYTHVVNDRGDWIERLTFVDGASAPSLRVVRAITYLD
ncbi:MAG TPA: hypothetical protein VF883_21995 [Thermoanaerobaculia bacterium]|jgi:hypothetical protein